MRCAGGKAVKIQSRPNLTATGTASFLSTNIVHHDLDLLR